MPINAPVIAAGPSVQKTDVATTVCLVLNTGDPPPWVLLGMVDGIPKSTQYPPQWHGQMIVTKATEAEYGLMYIAVEQDGVLEWKSVNLGYVVADKRTDRKKDPFLDFY